MKVQDIIKRRRLELELTLKDVAKALGVAESTVSRYESGEIQNIGIDKVEALSRVLRYSPGYLMGWEDKPNPSSNEEETLLIAFRKLNKAGRNKLLERAEELLDLGYVQKGGRSKNGLKYSYKKNGNIIELTFRK